jgi:hypothetical protein
MIGTLTHILKPKDEILWSVVGVEDLRDHQTYHGSKYFKAEDPLCYVTLRHTIN